MRVVLDTNIFISGIFFHGLPGKIIDAWVDEAFSLFITPSILKEYTLTIADISLKHDDILVYDWLQALAELSHVVPDPFELPPYCRDKNDDKFVHCAISAKVDYLVSGDKDLLVLTKDFSFNIISPAKFLNMLSKHH